MNLRPVAYIVGHVFLLLAVLMVVPLAVGLCFHSDSALEGRENWAFVATALASGVVGLTLRYLGRAETQRIQVREGFAIVTFTWLVLGLVGMGPYLFAGATSSVTDAFFETMSGFTTTGSTIFPDVEMLPHGLQFYRHFTQWLGGGGVIVLGVALLPLLDVSGVGGFKMLRAEASGGLSYERDRPRIADAAILVWKLYAGLTAAQIVLLVLFGMPWFDAICHAFATLATGGFSSKNASIGYYASPYIQWIVIVFMILGGINFALHLSWLKGELRPVFQNPELRLFLTMIGLVTLLGVLVVPLDGNFEVRLRTVMFQVVTLVTSTGFATADYEPWPHVMRMALLLLIFVGGCIGSTSGGLKVGRLAIYLRAPILELHRLMYPHSVRPLRMGDKALEPSLVAQVVAFGLAYSGVALMGTVFVTAFGYDPVTAFSAVAASMSNAGPGLGEASPAHTFAPFPAACKWLFAVLMLVGRLELFTVFVLFTPWAWRR